MTSLVVYVLSRLQVSHGPDPWPFEPIDRSPPPVSIDGAIDTTPYYLPTTPELLELPGAAAP